MTSALLQRLADGSARMLFREEVDPVDEFDVLPVRHRVGNQPSAENLATIEKVLGDEPELEAIRQFYASSDGADVCVVPDTEGNMVPLLRLLSVEEWGPATAARHPGGEWDWTVDLNAYKKVRTLYRGDTKWLVFGTVESGVLTTFLEGPDTGKVFYLAPEPGWNIAKPLFSSFAAFCDALASDMAAVFRRLRVVSPEGIRPFKYVLDGA